MHVRELVRNRITVERLPVVPLATALIALLAWLAVIGRWLPMPGGPTDASMRMADPGVPEAMALSNGPAGVGLYLAMWGVMMVAMMYPASVPLFRLYTRTLAGTTRRGKATRVAGFMAGYALVWTLTGVVPLGVNAAVPVATLPSEYAGYLRGGALLLLAGYQLSPFKHQCLRHCRSPMGLLMSRHRPGVRGAVRMSWAFSRFCVGCCWALFAFMVVVGSMNLVWMALITAALSLERAVAWGDWVARGTGIAAGVAGIAVLVATVV